METCPLKADFPQPPTRRHTFFAVAVHAPITLLIRRRIFAGFCNLGCAMYVAEIVAECCGYRVCGASATL